MIFRSVSSSNVAQIGYDPIAQKLGVKFRTGAIYYYLGVPESVYRAFLNSSSKGAFVHAHLKGRFQTVRG